MTHSIPWLRVSLEGLVIVSSILLAFGIEAWWTRTESNRDALGELGTVLEEVHEARTQLQDVVRWREREQSAAASVQTRLEGVPIDENIALPDTLFALSFGLQLVSDAPTQAAEAFVTSGYIDVVEDVELRQALLAWTSLVVDLRDDEVRFGITGKELLEDFYDRMVLTAPMALLTPVFLAGPLAPVASGGDNVLAKYSTRARNLLAHWVGTLQLLSRQSSALLDRADELISLIERELSRYGA
tara:strand:+ start:57 stop:785 length:729 start_codon:yes stop_codon:yes gene_type:complete